MCVRLPLYFWCNTVLSVLVLVVRTCLPVTVLGGSLELVAILMEDTVCCSFSRRFSVSSLSVCTVVMTHAQCDGEVAMRFTKCYCVKT